MHQVSSNSKSLEKLIQILIQFKTNNICPAQFHWGIRFKLVKLIMFSSFSPFSGPDKVQVQVASHWSWTNSSTATATLGPLETGLVIIESSSSSNNNKINSINRSLGSANGWMDPNGMGDYFRSFLGDTWFPVNIAVCVCVFTHSINLNQCIGLKPTPLRIFVLDSAWVQVYNPCLVRSSSLNSKSMRTQGGPCSLWHWLNCWSFMEIIIIHCAKMDSCESRKVVESNFFFFYSSELFFLGASASFRWAFLLLKGFTNNNGYLTN